MLQLCNLEPSKGLDAWLIILLLTGCLLYTSAKELSVALDSQFSSMYLASLAQLGDGYSAPVNFNLCPSI